MSHRQRSGGAELSGRGREGGREGGQESERWGGWGGRDEGGRKGVKEGLGGERRQRGGERKRG